MRKVLYLLGEPLDIQTLYEQSIYIVLRFKNGEVRKDMTGFDADLAVWLNQGANLIEGSTQSGAITFASTANDAILDEMRILIDFIGTNTACPAPYSYSYRLNIEKNNIDTFALNGKFVILDVAPDGFQIEDVQPSTVTFVQTSVTVSVQTMDVAQLRNETLVFRNQAEIFNNSASSSATTATTKATEASNSATSAGNSATVATTKAGEASTSATNANTSATNAQASADSANATAQTVGNVVNRELQILPVKAGSAMNIGTPVYVSGADGTNNIVSPASNASEATSSKVLGLLMQTLANNGQGSVVTGGKFAGLNTSTATLGDAVWLGSTAGSLIFGLTNKPVAPAHLVYLGVVSRVHATLGEITVRVQNGFEMNEIHNYLEVNKQDGDIIQYDGGSGLYKNKSATNLLANSKGIASYNDTISIEKSIATAIKNVYLELKSTYAGNDISIRTLGYVSGTGLLIQIYNVTTSAVIYTVILSSDTTKPTGVKKYSAHLAFEYYLELMVDWSSFGTSFLQSTVYSVLVPFASYNSNRTALNQSTNGISSYSLNGNDEKIANAIKNLYFEYSDATKEFAVQQIGFDVSNLYLKIRNITDSVTITYVLSLDTAKPTGVKKYRIHNTNESYMELVANWDTFPSQSLLSTTYTTKIIVNPYDYSRTVQITKMDDNFETIKILSPVKLVTGIFDLSKLSIETGSILNGVDSISSNRLRTKYSVLIRGGSTLNYTIATNYSIIVQQVLTTGAKIYTYIVNGDSGIVSGTGSIVLNTKTDSIRIAFRKVSGVTEIKINSDEINVTNFALTGEFGYTDSINNATKFTDNSMFNNFVREMFVEGLDPTIPYQIYYVQRNPTTLQYKLYIYNKNTNTSVFTFAPNIGDIGEKGIFDKTISGVRVRAVFNWNALPVLYNISGTAINLTDKIFDLNYSPSIRSFFADKEVRGSRLINTRNASAIDSSSIFNAIVPHKNFIPALMNSINAEQIKASTLSTYDTISYAKNGSIGILLGSNVFEFCQEKDSSIYDTDANLYVRKIDLITKAMLTKTRILGYGDTVLGEQMTKIPYVYSGVQIGTIIRIYVQVKLITSGVKWGYIDFNTTDSTFSQFVEITLNTLSFTYLNYFAYLRDAQGSTLISAPDYSSRDLALGKHIMSYNGYYYTLIGTNVGVAPYTGCYHSIAKSVDGVSWTIIYTFSDRGGQDDGDMYIKDGILYAQLRQNWGSNFTIIVAYNLTTNKEIASQMIKGSTCRGEFFEYSGKLYILFNIDESRQYAVLHQISCTNELMEITPVLSVQGFNSNWSIHTYNAKIYVFFGVQVWEFKIDAYNNSVSTTLFNLLK